MFGILPICWVIFDVRQSEPTGVWRILTLWLADYGLSLTVCCYKKVNFLLNRQPIARLGGGGYLFWIQITYVPSLLCYMHAISYDIGLYHQTSIRRRTWVGRKLHYGNHSRGCLMGGGPLWPPTVPRLAARSSQSGPPSQTPRGLGQSCWSASEVTWPRNVEFWRSGL